MQTETFTVRNVKCGGCVKTIQDGLAPLPGVRDVQVSIDDGRVDVQGEALARDALQAKLGELGYPVAE